MRSFKIQNEHICHAYLLFTRLLPELDLGNDYPSIEEISDYTIRNNNFIKILFVGSNPSQSSKTTIPFAEDTRSYKFIHKHWMKDIDEKNIFISYKNVSDEKTFKNRPLRKSEINHDLIRSTCANQFPDFKIIGCGKAASKALKDAGVTFFEMPHPSGLCRFWNDKDAGEKKIKEMWKWIHKTKS